MPDKGESRKGFEPAKARWLEVVSPALLAAMQAASVYSDAKGDWMRVVHAAPFALCVCAALLGAGLLIRWVVDGVESGRWDRIVIGPRHWSGAISWALWLIACFFGSARMSLSPYSGEAWNWRPVALPSVDWKLQTLLLLSIGGFVLLLNWWLGFIERDRARAMERDQLNARQVVGRR